MISKLLSRALKPTIQPKYFFLTQRAFSTQRRRGQSTLPNANSIYNTPIDRAVQTKDFRNFNLQMQQILEKDPASFSNINLYKLKEVFQKWHKFGLKISEELQMELLKQLNKMNFEENSKMDASRKMKNLDMKVHIIYLASKISMKFRHQKQIVSNDKTKLLLSLITKIFKNVKFRKKIISQISTKNLTNKQLTLLIFSLAKEMLVYRQLFELGLHRFTNSLKSFNDKDLSSFIFGCSRIDRFNLYLVTFCKYRLV